MENDLAERILGGTVLLTCLEPAGNKEEAPCICISPVGGAQGNQQPAVAEVSVGANSEDSNAVMVVCNSLHSNIEVKIGVLKITVATIIC